MPSPRPDTESIFYQAMQQQSPADRAAYLVKACGDDEKLRAEIARLLQAYDAAGGFLAETQSSDQPTHSSTGSMSTGLTSAALLEGPGALVGRYKLLQKIGEGGFGSVFL